MNAAKPLLAIMLAVMINDCRAQLRGLSFKAGLAHSTQQWGRSPFDHIRPPDKSIQSGFVSIGYDLLRSPGHDLVIGGQYVEKGFRIRYGIKDGSGFEQESAYQYLLQYAEVPVYYRFRYHRFFFSAGSVVSYLVNDVYSYREDLKNTNPVTGKVTTYSVAYNLSYNSVHDRINTWDWGLGLGVAYEIVPGLEAELNAQKHFILLDKWEQKDLVYNLSFLLGLKYTL